MISEELVASGGTQMHEADIPKSLKATAAQEPRVSVDLCASRALRACLGPSYLGRLQGSRGSWEWAQETASNT